MDLSKARELLLEQHVRLRALLVEAAALARRQVAGEPVEAALESAVDRARQTFDEHNRFESSLLGPFFEAAGITGVLRLERMVAEHCEEHDAFSAFLRRPATELAPELADFVEELDAHIDAEERTFLAPLRR